MTYCSWLGVARVEYCIIGEGENSLVDAVVELHFVSTYILRGARTVAENGITNEGCMFLLTIEGDTVGRMAWCKNDLQGEQWIGFQTDNVTIIEILSTVQIDISATIGT